MYQLVLTRMSFIRKLFFEDKKAHLGGGLKHFLFLPLPGKTIQFD